MRAIPGNGSRVVVSHQIFLFFKAAKENLARNRLIYNELHHTDRLRKNISLTQIR